jgi:hypothetical protein
MKLRALRFASCLLIAACLSAVALTTACTAAQWASFVTVSTTLATYVLAFLSNAQAAWALILPLLGSAAPDADKVFQNAVITVANAVAAMQNAVQAATLAQQPTLDISALMQDVKNAVSSLMVIYNQYKVTTPAAARVAAASYDTLDAHARAIAAWR